VENICICSWLEITGEGIAVPRQPKILMHPTTFCGGTGGRIVVAMMREFYTSSSY